MRDLHVCCAYGAKEVLSAYVRGFKDALKVYGTLAYVVKKTGRNGLCNALLTRDSYETLPFKTVVQVVEHARSLWVDIPDRMIMHFRVRGVKVELANGEASVRMPISYR